MVYKISPGAYSGIFAVPSVAVDNYIRLAGGNQWRVLLYMLRNSAAPLDTEAVALAVGIHKEEVLDAARFWAECGILEAADTSNAEVSPITNINQNTNTEITKEPEAESKEKSAPAPLPISKPTMEQISLRAAECSEIRFLFNEAQQRLGRTIGYNGQSVLLMMHDEYGLPTEVILTIIGYAVSMGKTSNSYISKIGRDWAQREIDSIEKAEEQLEYLCGVNRLWKSFCGFTGVSNPKPTEMQAAYLLSWHNEMGFNEEMIFMAYEEMANHTSKMSFPYMNKVLMNWKAKGIKTPEDVEAEKKTVPVAAQGKKGKERSYDLDEYTNSAVKAPPVYVKRREENGV